MCSQLLKLLQSSAADDTEILNLVTALQAGKIFPRGEEIMVALLGEQGIGKSTLINTLFDRPLASVHCGSTACTKYATFIRLKLNASEDIRQSDISIDTLSNLQIAYRIDENFRRIEPLIIPSPSGAVDSAEDVSGDASAEAMSSVREAKSFFDLLFEKSTGVLDHYMQHGLQGLQNDNFREERFKLVKSRILEMKQRLIAFEAEPMSAEVPNIHDDQLREIRGIVDEFSSLIKAMHIRTDHHLLSNNVTVIDVPGQFWFFTHSSITLTLTGYGDSDHVRTAVIDEVRDMAHFEIIVAPMKRVFTTVTQERYIDRSVQRRDGARNTLLLCTRSDVSELSPSHELLTDL